MIFKVRRNSFINKTGQKWKVAIAFLFLALAFLFIVLDIWIINDPKNVFFSIVGLEEENANSMFLIFILIFLYFLFFTVKCPACKKKILYKIISNCGLTDWITLIVTFEDCPFCGSTGTRGKDKI